MKLLPNTLKSKMIDSKAINSDRVLFNTLYDKYAPSFYGELKKNFFKQEICDGLLINAYHQIWKNLADLHTEKNHFIYCYRIVRKEISKKKVDLLLKELFACQRFSSHSNTPAKQTA